jgi:membrane associated rhomboid family serine protease
MNNIESPAALIIFCATIGISLYALYGKRQNLIDKFALQPWKVFRQMTWYQTITSGFLHADMMHMMFNMLTFYFFAFQLEKVIGTGSFVVIYFGSMMLADVTSLLKHKDDYAYRSIGASGAISGVLFSFILFFPKAPLGIMFLPIPIPAPIFAVLYLAYCYYAARHADDMINHEAHFWGALAGVVLTVLLKPNVVDYFLNQIKF